MDQTPPALYLQELGLSGHPPDGVDHLMPEIRINVEGKGGAYAAVRRVY